MDLITMYLQKREEKILLEKRLCAEEQERIDYGEALREWRLSLGVFAKQMAKDLGISPQRLRRLERGKRVREPKLLRSACDTYLELEALRQRYQCLQVENNQLRRVDANIVVQFGNKQWSLPVDARRRVI